MTPTVVTYSHSGACPPPATVPDAVRAHQIMRDHLRCLTESCGQRQTALTVLAEAGEYTLTKPPSAPTHEATTDRDCEEGA